MTIAFTGLLHLLDITRSVQLPPAEVRSREHPRSFADWTREERQLLLALSEAGFIAAELAPIFQRTANAIERQLERWDDAEGPSKPNLHGLPHSRVPLHFSDIELLVKYAEKYSYVRDPLGWQYGARIELPPSTDEPLLLCLEVEPDAQTGLTLPIGDSPLYWPMRLQELEDLVRATWLDVGAQVAREGGTVLCGEGQNVGAVRKSMERVSGSVPPRGSVCLSEKLRQTGVVLLAPSLMAQIPSLSEANYVIAVVPKLPQLAGMAAQSTYNLELPYMLQRPLDDESDEWTEQVAFLRQRLHKQLQVLGSGRQVVRQSVIGLTNQHGQLARLNWSSLKGMPDVGTVHAARPDLLVRALSWLALESGRLGQSEVELQLPFEPGELALEEAVGHLAEQHDLDLADRLALRCWLDVGYSEEQLQEVELRFIVDREMNLAYIGH